MPGIARKRDPRLVALSDDLLECRERHPWDDARAHVQRYRYSDGTYTVETSRPCARCGSIQFREIVTYSRRGGVEPGAFYRRTWIDYSSGYLIKLKEGEERLPRSTFRLERVRRWLDANPLPVIDRK